MSSPVHNKSVLIMSLVSLSTDALMEIVKTVRHYDMERDFVLQIKTG